MTIRNIESETIYTLTDLIDMRVVAVLIDNQRFTNVQSINRGYTVTLIIDKTINAIKFISGEVLPVSSLELEYKDGTTQYLVRGGVDVDFEREGEVVL